ncbi:hypothetical protein [Streptomyces tsukubensis]|uniref:hypothetical protein n=1 Tax=Streptomyces tsukubensis TaxID=83656 RepID=UPI00344D163F
MPAPTVPLPVRRLPAAPRWTTGRFGAPRLRWCRTGLSLTAGSQDLRCLPVPVLSARALAVVDRIMAQDQPLPADEEALAALCRDLAAYTQALTLALAVEQEFAAEAGAASDRAARFLRRSGEETGFRAVISMVMAAESVGELATLALAALDAQPDCPSADAAGGVR